MILWDGQECELRDLKRVWQSDYKPTFVTRLVHGLETGDKSNERERGRQFIGSRRWM